MGRNKDAEMERHGDAEKNSGNDVGRSQVLADVKESLKEYANGNCKVSTVEEIMREITSQRDQMNKFE